jgi:hypothetical protein
MCKQHFPLYIYIYIQVVRRAKKAAQTQGNGRGKIAVYLQAQKDAARAAREPRKVYFNISQVSKRLQTARGEGVPSEAASTAAQHDLDRSLLILLHNRAHVMKPDDLKPLQRLQRESREWTMRERVVYASAHVKEFIRQHEARGLVFWFDTDRFAQPIPRARATHNPDRDANPMQARVANKPVRSTLAPASMTQAHVAHRAAAEALSKWLSEIVDPCTGNRFSALKLRSSWWAHTWTQPKYTMSSQKVIHTVNSASRDVNAVMQLVSEANPTLAIVDSGGRCNWTMAERRRKLARIAAYAQNVVDHDGRN